MLPLLLILLVFLGLGLAVLLKCPPLWRDYDALIQVTAHPNDMTLLQYPAAYPFFSRIHIYAAEIVQGWRDHRKVSIQPRRVVILNDAGLHALTISQQILLALALTSLVWCSAHSLGGRWAMVCILASNASIFVTANLISTEALAEVLIIALVAISIWLFRATKLSVLGIVAYGFCLFAAIMTRHANAIFAMLLPVAFLLRCALNWIRTRGICAESGKRAALFILVGLLCIAADQGTTRLLCWVFQVQYRSISARATSERLGFVNLMTPPEREAFLADLETRSEDPVIKEAIPLLARPATWVQQRDEIEKILLRTSPALDAEPLKVKADAYLDTIATLFFRTHNRYLVQETLNSIWRTMTRTTPTEVTSYYLNDGAWSIDLYAGRPDFSKKTHGLEVCSPEAKARIVAFEDNPWLRFWQWVPHGLVLLVGSVMAGAFLLRKIGDPSIPLFALATAATGLTATCLTFILVNYNPRFTAVAGLFACLTLAIIVAHWFDARRSRVAELASEVSGQETGSLT
jgi:hypothetical protein